jgi:3-hydroxyisobutyrate dehydrogenase-like beta-hydroxyacid dehydrogenase
MTTVGIVGLGLLGSSIAARFVKAGHAVVGFDILPDRVAALTAMGGKAAASSAAVARTAEAVCTLLPSLAAAESAILGSDGIVSGGRPGLTVIQMSTISPTLTERLAREVTGNGMEFLDCPVSGTTSMIDRGDGSFIVGGTCPLRALAPVLESALPRVVHVGRGARR